MRERARYLRIWASVRLKLCLVPEYAWPTVETQFRYFQSAYVAAQYAWILHRPWQIIRGCRYSLLKRTFDFSEHVASEGRHLSAGRVCGYFDQ